MRKIEACLLVLLLGVGGFGSVLHAQETGPEEGEIPIESEWDIYAPEFYSRGDQTFIISFGVVAPTMFFGQDGIISHNISPPVGGTGSLAYNYFFTSHLSLGGEVGGMFTSTVGQNVLYIIPIGLRVGYQFIFRRFEFPLALTVGIAPQRYLNLGYLGLFAKAGGSVFFRFNPDWSFGVNANWGWYPQWVKKPEENVHANIMDITVAARYHF
jgi:hypothetical protein